MLSSFSPKCSLPTGSACSSFFTVALVESTFNSAVYPSSWLKYGFFSVNSQLSFWISCRMSGENKSWCLIDFVLPSSCSFCERSNFFSSIMMVVPSNFVNCTVFTKFANEPLISRSRPSFELSILKRSFSFPEEPSFPLLTLISIVFLFF